MAIKTGERLLVLHENWAIRPVLEKFATALPSQGQKDSRADRLFTMIRRPATIARGMLPAGTDARPLRVPRSWPLRSLMQGVGEPQQFSAIALSRVTHLALNQCRADHVKAVAPRYDIERLPRMKEPDRPIERHLR